MRDNPECLKRRERKIDRQVENEREKEVDLQTEIVG